MVNDPTAGSGVLPEDWAKVTFAAKGDPGDRAREVSSRMPATAPAQPGADDLGLVPLDRLVP